MTPSTKQRILDAAEVLFAEHGFAATSLRAITAEAEVNLAAVNYHFRSKEGLFGEVCARRIGPINAARLTALDELEAAAAPAAPDLEQLIAVFLRPALQLARTPRGPVFMRLAGRIYSDPGAHWLEVAEQFDEIRERFLAALGRALPDVPRPALLWRVHFMIGVMCHTLSDTHRLLHLSKGLCEATDVDAMMQHLVPFLASGFRAPLPTTQPGGLR